MDNTSSSISTTPLSVNLTFPISMTLNSSLVKKIPIYMNADTSSLPHLFSSTLSDLFFSSDTVSRQLVKNKCTKLQSPRLTKGEVHMRKKMLSSGETNFALKSHDTECVMVMRSP